jgi:YesN/AraC family two-component response regulator
MNLTVSTYDRYPYKSGSSQVLINNEKHILAHIPSRVGGFTYTVLFPEETVLSTVIKLKNQWIIIIVLILLAGVSVFILLTSLNYRPLNKLMNTIIDEKTSEKLSKQLSELKEHDKNILAAELTAYLDTHYNDTNFSLQIMAEEFSMPVPILTKYFKDHIGVTILDYITAIRIKQASLLLSNSLTSIKEIGIQIGFVNETSFIRRYKQVTGLTPGQYRLKNRINSSLTNDDPRPV